MAKRRWIASLVVVVAAAGVALSTTTTGTGTARAAGAQSARAAAEAPCANHYSAKRVSGNPLDLRTAPGSNPLHGAQFFVDGPAHGDVAGAIAKLVGLNPANYDDGVSWATFKNDVARALGQHAGETRNVNLLEKIANEPEPLKFSTSGGNPSAISAQTKKIICYNLAADPGTVPIVTTYFLHATLKGCPSSGEIRGYMPTFESQINAMVNATGNQPIVYLLEEDALGSSGCIAKHGGLPAWEAALRYEVNKVATLPHAVVYVEAGYSDANTVQYTAKALNAVGVRHIRGFWTNDTHLNWTINEINWGDKVSKLTHGAHFVIDTAGNGNGPLKNPHPATEGVEDLCNPPGRALGPQTSTSTGFKQVDAYLWSNVPGASSGPCHGGPPGGVFWLQKAEDLASHANNRIGPSPKYPSRPY